MVFEIRKDRDEFGLKLLGRFYGVRIWGIGNICFLVGI